MRTLGFRTHVLLAIAGAAGLVFALGRPWYAAAPEVDPNAARDIGDINGPLNAFFAGVERWLTGTVGQTGWQALDYAAIAIAAMAGLAAVGALACMAPPLQMLGRDLLRYGALFAFAIAAWKVLDPPGTNAAIELRHGALAAVGCATVLLTGGLGAASAPLRRRTVARKFEAPPPPAPPAYGTTGSTAPPG
jgi:hypothetical protein